MISPLSPMQIGPQDQPDLVGSYLNGRQGAQRIQLNDQAIQQNQQQMSAADLEHNVQRLQVANRIFTKAKELPQAERANFMNSLNDGMLASVGADKKTLMQTGMDDTSLDAAIAQTGNALSMHRASGEAASFNEMTKNMAPADVEKARRINLGLDPRMQGSAAITIANQGLTDKVGASEASIAGQKKGAENAQDISAKPIIAGGEANARAAVELATKPQIERETTAAKTQAEMDTKNAVEGKNKLPLLEDTTNNLIRYVDETKNHPGRKFSTGGYSLIPVVPGSPQADFKTRMDQIHGAGFLQAYNSLKGGGAGAITDIEGKKATEASNRMSAATSDAEFDAAAQDFKDILKQNLERARGQADQLQPSTTKKDRPPLSSFQKD